MSKISIIIPVYNVEKYIDKCIDKCIEIVIEQTYKDIEGFLHNEILDVGITN